MCSSWTLDVGWNADYVILAEALKCSQAFEIMLIKNKDIS